MTVTATGSPGLGGWDHDGIGGCGYQEGGVCVCVSRYTCVMPAVKHIDTHQYTEGERRGDTGDLYMTFY